MIYHDLTIVGGGPAGLTAAIYADRAAVDAVTVESGSWGGQISQSELVDNYPGFESISGFDLGMRMHDHAEHLGAAFAQDTVHGLGYDAATQLFLVEGASDTYQSRAVILATGGTPRPAGFEGEEEFRGRGVSYCATCDGMFYRDKITYVVGGGNTACEEADFLSRICSKVIMVVRKDHLRAQASLVERVELNPKVELRYNSAIAKLEGDGLPEAITLRDTVTGDLERIEHGAGTFGVFVFIGTVPSSKLVEGLADLNDNGEVVTSADMSTATPGLFVAGDVRQTPLRQVVTAAADGAIAANSAALFLGNLVI